jgi:aryl-alcohol dehydrogenase-like predicted oxidoreductase
MHYRTFGRTRLQVSAVSMSTWKSFDVRGQPAIQQVSELVTEALRYEALRQLEAFFG